MLQIINNQPEVHDWIIISSIKMLIIIMFFFLYLSFLSFQLFESLGKPKYRLEKRNLSVVVTLGKSLTVNWGFCLPGISCQ